MRLSDVIWIAIIITLATIIGVYLSGYGNCCDLTKMSATAQPVTPACVTSEERIIIRAATLAAIEDGLKQHMNFLFTGWIKDPTHQPQRASAGLQKAIVAYQQARADALKWNPAIC